MEYPIPTGMHAIPLEKLDLRSDEVIDQEIQNPANIAGEKNIWFFWHSGYATMHLYSKRNVRAWHRRFSRLGWTVRVVDRADGSSQNISNYVDVDDPANFPAAFRHGTIEGLYAAQHTSDLVRWPLLLKYGGVYADCGMIQIGDLDQLWDATVGNDASPYEVLSYNCGSPTEYGLTNYFLCSRMNNPLFLRCHQLLIALWAEDGGRTTTEGMHASALLQGVPLQGDGDETLAFTENGRSYTSEEGARLLTDYIIQGQAMSMVMGLVDSDGDWNGPQYIRDHVYAIDFMVGAQLINKYTAWNGTRAFELMSLPLPAPGSEEGADQAFAKEIVCGCLTRSFGFKLATGLILRVIGPTLSSLWRQNEETDNIPGTFAHWFRHGVVHWTQDRIPPNVPFETYEPLKIGPLL